jgi:DNA-binding NarL/FixJ family response regulator
MFRDGIKALFRQTGIEIVGEAATAQQTLMLVEGLRPDVVLLDATMPNLSCSETTRRIKAAAPQVEVLILSLDDDEQLIANCLRAGAAGYIRRDDQPLQVLRSIRNACRRVHAA